MSVKRIVCWKCHRGGAKGDKPLRKISELDYACEDHLADGLPPIGNVSFILLKTKEELEAEEQERLDWLKKESKKHGKK